MSKVKNKEVTKVDTVPSLVVEQTTVVNKEVVVEPTIFDKYRKFLNQVKDNYISGLEYGDIMAMLRYTEEKLNKTIPMNTSCPQCVMDLIRIFSRLEV